MTHAVHYRVIYKDAYVAAAQLKAIGDINSPDDPDLEIAEKAVFICYENFKANGGSFVDPSPLAKTQRVNFRNITKDSIRCMLIYLTIFQK